MNNDIVLDVKNVSKKYVIAAGYQPDSLREKIVELIKYPIKIFNGTHKKRYKDYWALKDVTFQVKRGEVLGIVGKNGAGKSTLLKILSRVTEPTSGSITMKGRVSSLLEVGTGFNPELTGRENIYLNGAIIGMGKKEINAKFNDIVEFAGIGDFLDTPVKRYSSGMYVRLGFAVAAHLESDILLVDEVLAVGDSEFQDKCLNKMSLLAQSGRTVIFISHNMQAVSKLCRTAYLIESGKILMHGSTQDVISKYMGSSKLSVGVKLDDRKDREGQANIVIRSIAVSSSEKDQYPISGELMKINITVENISQSVINYYPSLSIRTIDQSPLISLDAKINKFRRIIKPMELQKIECNIKNIMLSPGEYDINAALYDLEGNTEDWVVRAIRTKLRRNESLFNNYPKNFPVITNFNWN